MINVSNTQRSGLAATEWNSIASDEEELRHLKERLEAEFEEFISKGARLFDSEEWDPPRDAQLILRGIESGDFPRVWLNFLQDPSSLQNECLAKEIKRLFLQGMGSLLGLVDQKVSSDRGRFLVALNEHLQLTSAMQILDGLVEPPHRAYTRPKEKRGAFDRLLKLLIQTHSLEKGWLKSRFSSGSASLVSVFMSVLLELDEGDIEEYAKECAFCFCLEDPALVNRDKLFSLWQPYGVLCSELYKHEKRKRDLFLHSLHAPLDEHVFATLFTALNDFRPKEEWIDPIYFSLPLSKEARGFFLLQLLVDDRKGLWEAHNRDIKELLRREESIFISAWPIFLPVEENPYKKKEMLELLSQIIKNPKIDFTLPVAWVGTLVLYLLDLSSEPKRYDGARLGRREEFGAAWVERMVALEPLPLTEEDCVFLIDIFGFLSRKKIELQRDFQDFRPILQNIFLTLDKLRLSAEILPEISSASLFIEKTESLMTKILTCFSAESTKGFPLVILSPSRVASSLLRKEITEEEVIRIMERIQSLPIEQYPLVKPFLRSVGAFQKGAVLHTR